jgi:multicomponent Na+:H+ antiporter subunit D
MRQDNLKARLAYSTISQLGYVVLGALLANSLGILGSTLHIAMHAFGKITLFFCAGAILVATRKTEISQMRGLGHAMPITMTAFLIGSLSIIGLPPTGGMWSKWYLALGTVDAGQFVLLAVLMVSSLLNIAYLLPIPIRAFLQKPERGRVKGIQEAPLPCLAAILFTSFGCVALFLYPQPLYWLARLLVAG